MLLSIITIFKMGSLSDLKATVSSVKLQNAHNYEHIIVASSIVDEVGFEHEFKDGNTKIVLNKDHSLYDAMNIGLHMSCGDAVIFLNAGDEFNDSDSIRLVTTHFTGNRCLAFRTIQYYGNDYYVRPSIARMSNLMTYPGHQGFVAPLPIAKKCTFNYVKYPISADSVWMGQLINLCGIDISSKVLSKFPLGGISNNPSIKSIRVKNNEFGIIQAGFEFIKYLLLKCIGHKNYYRIIYYVKYDHFLT